MNPSAIMMWYLTIAAVITPIQDQAIGQRDLTIYLPLHGEVAGWKEIGPARKFVGEDLYDLIDGGAVIYFEYGFEQVIAQEYESMDGHSIGLQIYEMTDPSSAFGIYTFLRGMDEEISGVGSQGTASEHHIYFWKGNYLVSLTASDSRVGASRVLQAFAAEVDRRITATGQRPALCNLLTLEGKEPDRVYYFEGELALSSLYYFAPDNVFGIEQGVAGDFNGFRVFIFRYRDAEGVRHWYSNARNVLKEYGQYTGLREYENEFSMENAEGSIVHVKSFMNFIFIYVGNCGTSAQAIFRKIEYNLR